MRTKRIQTFALSFLCLIIGGVSSFAQTNPSYYQTEMNSAQGASNLSPGVIIANIHTGKQVNSPSLLKEKTKHASLILKVSLGNDYVVKDFTDPKNQFSGTIQLRCFGGSFDVTKTLTISDDKPEQIVVIDLLNQIQSGILPADVNVELVNNQIAPVMAGGFAENYLNAKLLVSAAVERYYGVDVRYSNDLLADELVCLPVTAANSRVTFQWSNTQDFSNYEVQILRLYNEDITTIGDEHSIKTSIDWNKALKVETQSYEKQIVLSMMEGTGYYVWRVRPIGNYYDGSIGNSENYGKWSATLAGTSILINSATTSPNLFFVNDLNTDLNWMYSRTFTEGDKNNATGVRTSEGMVFADPLLNTRQTQLYDSEKQTILVSQSFADYSGRNALSTIPVPVSAPDGLEGYKLSLVKNSLNQLYTAADFDDYKTEGGILIDKVENPSTISDADNFSYYNGAHPDGISSTEGYSFSRTIFKTDGTGRVAKASGIGKKHALGTIADGKGRITRILYSSPSDEELLRVFGEEAPLAESVIKTISVDPNGVVSIAYTSKEGKTIATALVGSDVSNLSTLGNITNFTIDNATNQNVLSGNVFESTKRLAFWNNKEVELTYVVENLPTNCNSCNYKVQFFLVDLNNQITYVSDKDGYTSANQILPFEAPANEEGLDFPVGWNWVKSDNSGVSPFSISGSFRNKFTLPEGEYILVKRLYSGNSQENIAADLEADANVVEKIMDAVTSEMQTASTQSTSDALQDYLANLSTLFNATTRSLTAINTALGFTDVEDKLTYIPAGFSITYTSNGANVPGTLTISNNANQDCAGCGSKDISIPKPEVCLMCDATIANDGFDGISTLRSAALRADLDINQPVWTDIRDLIADPSKDGFIAYLHENAIYKEMNGAQAFFDQYAPGFTENSLIFMLTNMVTSKYYVGQKKLDGSTYYAAKATENGLLSFIKNSAGELADPGVKYTPELLPGLDFNYNCKELYECWVQAVDMIGANEIDGDVNVMDAYNDQGETSSEEEQDSDENKEDAGDKGVLEAIVGVIIHVKMRKFNDSDEGKVSASRVKAMVNFPSLFMNCAGYQFDKIIDEDETVLPSDYDYNNSALFSGVTFTNELIFNPAIQSSGLLALSGWGTKAPVLLKESEDTPGVFEAEKIVCEDCADENENVQLAYPYILKPEWMFKYFVYNSAEQFNGSSTLTDDHRILVNQFQLEVQYGYNDLFVNCGNNYGACYGSKNSYYHKSWSAGQRLFFYQQISSGRKCPKSCDAEPTVIADPTVEDLTTEQKMLMANEKLEEAKSSCDARANEFKTLITNQLMNACYEIVECTDANSPGYQVGNSVVDLMVSKVVDECNAKIDIIIADLNLPTSTVYGTNADNDGDEIPETGEFPWSKLSGCNYVTDDGACHTTVKLDYQLFPECDQLILDQVENWDFSIEIIPFPYDWNGDGMINSSDCTSYQKQEWVDNSISTPGANCPTSTTPSGAVVSDVKNL